MVHPDMFSKAAVSNDTKPDKAKDGVKPNEVKEDVKSDAVKEDVSLVDVEIYVCQQFTNEKLFIAREHMLKWVHMVDGKLECDIVIGRSDSSRRKAFVTMRCERSDTYVPLIRKLKCDDTRLRKSGHSIACRLKPKENEIVSDVPLISVAPKDILVDLKRKKLEMFQISSWYRVCEDKFIVRDIFWTHPKSIKLFNIFSTVLMIDSTYKTNKYRVPLLEIVGVTSTEKTFSVGFAFLESEKEDNVTWALEMSNTLLKDQENTLKAIVTD
ncbi:uncharacterized protein LOC131597852 [Vicia villosa]|uniref:uncharacterized protein LOC131597852 n=1 Tax=Vicia villosa TaxID=3911 RepID=UPI00273BD54C|nr:uncharacterized protein LOC131597852 [Vicia villosa]